MLPTQMFKKQESDENKKPLCTGYTERFHVKLLVTNLKTQANGKICARKLRFFF